VREGADEGMHVIKSYSRAVGRRNSQNGKIVERGMEFFELYHEFDREVGPCTLDTMLRLLYM
jgi:hypothetical protein